MSESAEKIMTNDKNDKQNFDEMMNGTVYKLIVVYSKRNFLIFLITKGRSG